MCISLPQGLSREEHFDEPRGNSGTVQLARAFPVLLNATEHPGPAIDLIGHDAAIGCTPRDGSDLCHARGSVSAFGYRGRDYLMATSRSRSARRVCPRVLPPTMPDPRKRGMLPASMSLTRRN